MKDLTIKDIIDLVSAEVVGPEPILKRIFEWDFERDILISKWFLGLGASLCIAILVGYFNKSTNAEVWQLVTAFIGALLFGSYGFYRYRRTRLIHNQFIASLKIYF